MPSQVKKQRLCVIGDSQMGSLRVADTAGMFSWPDAYDVEYWGANGPKFRQLKWSDGALHATGEAIESVRMVNAEQRDSIAPEDFDILVFYGCRLRMTSYFSPMLHWKYEQGSWPSQAVMHATVDAHANARVAYRNARLFVEAGVKVVFVPSPLLTDGLVDPHGRGGALRKYPLAAQATLEDREHLWSAYEAVTANHGIQFVRQPEDTITSGLFTAPEYACEGADESRDNAHKSPAFAVRMIKEALAALKAETSRTSVALGT